MKRYLSLLLALIMTVMLGIPAEVKAAESGIQEKISAKELEQTRIYPTGLAETKEYLLEGEKTPSVSTNASTSFETDQELFEYLEEKVKAALLAGETEFPLASMGINKSQHDLTSFWKYSPYFGKGVTAHAWYYSDNTYAYLEIENPMTINETKAYFATVDEELARIDKLIKSDMADEDIALVIHDYLAYESEYSGALGSLAHQSAGVLMEKQGVCDSYANAFMYLMHRYGVECYITVSEEMNHAWNIVKVGGKYYHVDCTWDDPLYDRLGQVRHDYFLLSDTGISVSHSGWDRTDLVCNDASQEEAIWTAIQSPIIYGDDALYFILEHVVTTSGGYDVLLYSLCRYEYKTSDTIELLIEDIDTWWLWGDDSYSSYYNGCFSGLFLHDGELYYNTSTEIRKMSIDGTTDTLVYAPNVTNGYVYGSKRVGNTIQYVIKQSPSDQGTLYTAPITLPEVEPDPEPQPDPVMEFTDVPTNQWYYDSVKYVYDNGIMTGLTATTFGPDETLTRAQFATILYRSAGAPEVTYDNRFSDIPSNDWYSNAVIWANNVGVVTGLTATKYGPEEVITREQMATMMYRYANYLEYNTGTLADLDSYTDASKVSSYAVEPMRWAVGNGIINGKTVTTLDPLGKATRAECATIIMRFLEKNK